MKFDDSAGEVDTSLPLIYMWEIRDAGGVLHGRYVGKAKGGASRPRTHYSRNVANILAGRPYRKGKPEGFRRVHHALATASRNGLSITLTLLCNVPAGASIDAMELRLIGEHACCGSEAWQLNG